MTNHSIDLKYNPKKVVAGNTTIYFKLFNFLSLKCEERFCKELLKRKKTDKTESIRGSRKRFPQNNQYKLIKIKTNIISINVLQLHVKITHLSAAINFINKQSKMKTEYKKGAVHLKGRKL